MADRPTAYQLAAQLYGEHRIPSFPVRLAQDENGKWQKKPLVKRGQITRQTDPGHFGWYGANAIGVPMGGRSGLFTFDLDDYKPGSAALRWVKEQGLPPTRTHRTASGGTHMIYQMPSDLLLGNCAPKAHGLDVRGDGGFIVWADTSGLYSVIDSRAPVEMPRGVVDLLIELNRRRGRIVQDRDVPKPLYVDNGVLLAKLQALASDPIRNSVLLDRFRGSTVGLKDKSRSSMDMSVARLLARAGLSYDEIVATLLWHFKHGKAGRDGATDAVEREVCRCAHRAITQRAAARDLIRQQLASSIAGLQQRLTGLKDVEGGA